MIYFVQAGTGGPIKIGYCSDRKGALERRILALQVGNPFKLTVARTIPGGSRQLERRLHQQFRNLRMEGEWFAADPTLATLAEASWATDSVRHFIEVVEKWGGTDEVRQVLVQAETETNGHALERAMAVYDS